MRTRARFEPKVPRSGDLIVASSRVFARLQVQKSSRSVSEMLDSSQRASGPGLQRTTLPAEGTQFTTSRTKRLIVLTRSRPISIIGLSEVHACNKGTVATTSTVSGSLDLPSRTPFTDLCGYFAACKSSERYALCDKTNAGMLRRERSC